jgi:hypothetical protein
VHLLDAVGAHSRFSAGIQGTAVKRVHRRAMDPSTRHWLYDPATTRTLVVAHRPAASSVVSVVVSDVVWGDVVRLLRWADAGTRSAGELASGTWWRLAAACAALLRRLPGLCAEIGEPWSIPATADDDGPTGRARVARVAARLAAELRSGRPLPLHVLAGEVDALGAAAVSALVEGVQWPAQP